ncbi:MAG: PocR ligand-binding domain-containing protein [Phycisphaerae bacterium]|nr:PocR ligand-binding domain-containing protein [Phycisphaerae bacterium]
MENSLDLVIQPEFRRILDDFRELFDIRIAFFSATGEELFSGRNRPGCAYCRLLRKHFGAESACRDCDARGRTRARQTGRMTAYRCHGGMTEAIIPVPIGSILAGYVMIGQIRTTDSPPSAWTRRARSKRMHGRLLAAFRRQPRIDAGRMKKILRFFSLLVEYVSKRRFVQLRQPVDLQAVLEHLRRNLYRNVPLSEAARYIHRSPTTVSHRCAKLLGKSFKQLQIEMKLDQAEQWLAEQPSVPVQEVARRLGYDDPLYFSRLFKKYKGRPPSRIRSPRGTG